VPQRSRRGTTALLAFLPYFPLASGALTGKYRRGEKKPDNARLTNSASMAGRFLDEPKQDTVEKLRAFAESRGHSLLELAFSWLLRHRVVASVIAGATKPEQIRSNVQAAGWALNAEDLAEIDRIAPAGSLVAA
jgi:aryl-alcohol dehydrogenase-like predicted oxidoreductase